jgi:hypothetical protein
VQIHLHPASEQQQQQQQQQQPHTNTNMKHEKHKAQKIHGSSGGPLSDALSNVPSFRTLERGGSTARLGLSLLDAATQQHMYTSRT